MLDAMAPDGICGLLCDQECKSEAKLKSRPMVIVTSRCGKWRRTYMRTISTPKHHPLEQAQVDSARARQICGF
jgi:hypothetical protein